MEATYFHQPSVWTLKVNEPSSKSGLRDACVQTDLSLQTQQNLGLKDLLSAVNASGLLKLRPVVGECPLCGCVSSAHRQRHGKLEKEYPAVLNGTVMEDCHRLQLTPRNWEEDMNTSGLRKRKLVKEIPSSKSHREHDAGGLVEKSVHLDQPMKVYYNSSSQTSPSKRRSQDGISKLNRQLQPKHHCDINLGSKLGAERREDKGTSNVSSYTQQYGFHLNTEFPVEHSTEQYSIHLHNLENGGISSRTTPPGGTGQQMTLHHASGLSGQEADVLSSRNLGSDDPSLPFLPLSPFYDETGALAYDGTYEDWKSELPGSTSASQLETTLMISEGASISKQQTVDVSLNKDHSISKSAPSDASIDCDDFNLTGSSKVDSNGFSSSDHVYQHGFTVTSDAVVACPPSITVKDLKSSTEKMKAEQARDKIECQVCSDLSSGFYCGAFVCEACKKFYLRSLKQDCKKYTCIKNGQCEISKETRTVCQHCRFKKCIAVGMSKYGSTSNSDAHITSIPCRVCGAPSSGFHFGAVTCEGCKGFFRRTVRERDNYYSCSKSQKCTITESTRNICKFCRYKKCLGVGMKPDGSRIGRQPNAFKHAAMLELKQLHNMLKQESPQSSLASSPVPFTRTEQTKTTPTQEKTKLPSLDIPSSPDFSSTLIEVPEKTKKEPSEIKKEPILLQGLNNEELVTSLSAAFEELKPLKYSKTVQNYPADIDSNELWALMMADFEDSAKKVLSFAKTFPFFKEVSIEDQICLVQNSIYQLVHTLLGTLYNRTTREYCYFHFPKYMEQKILKSFPQFLPIVDHFHKVGDAMQLLNLNDVELAFFTALQLFSTDEGDFENEQKINEIQEKISVGLHEYLRKQYPDNSQQRYGLILLQLPILRLITVHHQQIIESMNKKKEDIEFRPSPLFEEMFLGSGQ